MKYRVAIIESDAEIRDLLSQILDNAGHDVVAAGSADALEPSWRGEVIVTDTFATPYESSSAARYVSSLRDRWHVPVIVLTGHSAAKEDEAMLGADAVLEKPFDLDKLVGAVSQAGDQQRANTRELA
jgi:DNA-binding NtrC family response regulator